jgi:hypothetical protein
MVWVSHWDIFKDLNFLKYNILYSVESQPTFRSNMSPPSSGSKNMSVGMKQVESRIIYFMPVSRLPFSSTPNMEATYSSEILEFLQ